MEDIDPLPKNIRQAIETCEENKEPEHFALLKTIWELLKELIKK